jgi:hypothetical protein
MNEIDYFKVFVLCSGDVVADVDHLHVKIIHLMCLSYIVIQDTLLPHITYYFLFSYISFKIDIHISLHI